jgi:hypothetical protein
MKWSQLGRGVSSGKLIAGLEAGVTTGKLGKQGIQFGSGDDISHEAMCFTISQFRKNQVLKIK